MASSERAHSEARAREPADAVGHPESCPSTRERLLDTAERLFARQGIRSTSLRTITTEAGTNLASVHYHFGSKDALVVEVFRRRIGPVNRERIRRLDAVEARGQSAPPVLEEVLDAFVTPALELKGSGEGVHLHYLMVRVHAGNCEDLRNLIYGQFHETVDRFVAAVKRCCPDLGPEDLALRLRFLIGSLAHAMIELPFLDRPGAPGKGHSLGGRETAAVLVQFAAAGFRAPAPTLRPANATDETEQTEEEGERE